MMISMFSIFDPVTSENFSMNWLTLLNMILIFNWTYWLIPSRFNMMWNMMINFIKNEFNIMTKKKNQMNLIMIFSMFYFIIILNLFSLMPYIFTPTSHLSLNLSMSLTMWITFMLFGWLLNTNHMFSHLVPLNTPISLMSFMVLIESISNIIRPWTLAIRLSANMLAGHLLLSLLSSTMENLFLMIPIMIMIQNLLLILEISVSIIQSYVFTILMTLYLNETN